MKRISCTWSGNYVISLYDKDRGVASVVLEHFFSSKIYFSLGYDGVNMLFTVSA